MTNKTHSSKMLTQLLKGIIDNEQLNLLSNIEINHIQLDSRLISSNGLFVALNGAQTDGRLYINKAIEQGAVAVLVEDNLIEENATSGFELKNADSTDASLNIPIIKVADLNSQLSEIASRFHDFPQKNLSLIGITGTNGKTTVNQLIGQWLTLLGKKVYCMGTLGNGLYGQLTESPNTTLNAIDLIAHLALAHQLNAEYVVMEVSSHGLSLDRVKSLHFDVAAFTNLTQDHLDFHGTMQDYSDAKLQLFSPQYSNKIVLNGADQTAKSWIKQWQDNNRNVQLCCFNDTHSLAQNNIYAKNVKYTNKGISASLVVNKETYTLSSKLLGAFNLDNLLTAFSCLYSAGFHVSELVNSLSLLSSVVGRMEVFANDKSPSVVVDYAHTPDALKQALQALKLHCSGQLWVVFGCGGDRDNQKRPLMAAIAEEYADKIVFTQDNSRSESPSTIFSQMLSGVKKPDAIVVDYERTNAVKYAIEQANVDDIVLLAGKGHENYQILQSGRINYDERALAQNIVSNLQ